MNPTAASLPTPIARAPASGLGLAAGTPDTPSSAATAGAPGANATEFARLLARSQDAAADTRRQAARQAERPRAGPPESAPVAPAPIPPTAPNTPAPAAPRAAGERPPAGDATASATDDADTPQAAPAEEAEAPTSTAGTQRPAARARPAPTAATAPADRRVAGRDPAGGAAAADALRAGGAPDESAAATGEASTADTPAAADERAPPSAAAATPTTPAPPTSAAATAPTATPATAATAPAGTRAAAADAPSTAYAPAAPIAAAGGTADGPTALAPDTSTTDRTPPGTLASVRSSPLGAADRAGAEGAGRAADPSSTPAAAFDTLLAKATADIGTALPTPQDTPMPAGAGLAGTLAAAGANAPRTSEAARAEPTPVDVPTPPSDPGFQQAIGVQVSLLARDGIQQAELRLNPADMGPVSVQITMTGDQARVDFGADLAQTRQALEAGWAELAASLQEAGFTLSGGGVSQHAAPRERSMPQRSGGRPIEAVVGVDSGDESSVGVLGMRPRAGAALDLYA